MTAQRPRQIGGGLALLSSVACFSWLVHHARCPAVRTWQPSSLNGKKVGDLWVRSGGTDGTTYILLHGMASSGDIFGLPYDSLAQGGRLIVPDLLGFARSMTHDQQTFTADDHIDALLAAIPDDADDIVIGAHSMGSALGLRLANRLGTRTRRVVCWGAPLFPPGQDALADLGSVSLMMRLLATNQNVAERLCAWNCRHRTAAGLLAALAAPQWPIPLSRQASLHTWPAYTQSLDSLVINPDWADLLRSLENTKVSLWWGDRDPIGRPETARDLTLHTPHQTVTVVAGADHSLPVTHAEQCIRALGPPASATPR